MRKDNSFKLEHIVSGDISPRSLQKGVTVRPYTNGVLLHVVKSFTGIEITIDGEDHCNCYPSVLKLANDLDVNLNSGTHLFLWHKQARGGASASVIASKQALLGKTSQAGFVLSPLKKEDEVYQTLDDIGVDTWNPGLTNKMKLLKWNSVCGPNDFKRQLKNIYGRGYISAVVRVGKKVYRICKTEEEHLTVVGFLESERWNEVGGILVEVPGLDKPVAVKRGLNKNDRREIFSEQSSYLSTKAVITHEGITSTNNLRNSRIRALKVTTVNRVA